MKKTINIGVMSGRLSKRVTPEIQAFPIDTWKAEFSSARSCGFDCIEWVFDFQSNPLFDQRGIKEMISLSQENDIKINAVCCDYFMERRLFGVSNFELERNLDTLKNLIVRCHEAGIKILELPLVDSSSLKNKKNQDEFVSNLEKIITWAEKNEIYLTLETDFSPEKFREFLLMFDHPYVVANYDTGNSASLDYDVKEELKLTGKWIKNIHLKDRILRGPTVPLGEGVVKFDKFFLNLAKIQYTGDLIIQGARMDDEMDPIQTSKKYYKFVKQYVDKYLL